MKTVLRLFLLALMLVIAWACPFDTSLREYLSARFWLPFAKRPAAFERPNVRRISAPFAGMVADVSERPLAKLRAAYSAIATPQPAEFDAELYAPEIEEARADSSLTPQEREEVNLIDAKIDLRAGDSTHREPLDRAVKKLEAFLRTAQSPEFRSEARGWLARAHYLLGNQTAAGKIYIDELNRDGSNLSRESLLNSLAMTYGNDGGPQLRQHLEEYFDTADHAAFAVQMVTNPRWNRYESPNDRRALDQAAERPPLISPLIQKHADLLRTRAGAGRLAVLAMRTALHEGDPAGARKLAEAVPADAAVRSEPDFQWMLASACFLSRDYAAAEAPLLALFRSRRATPFHKSAAAYGLCGVYAKTGNAVEQIRYALWMQRDRERLAPPDPENFRSDPYAVEYLSVYWANSGWDLGLLLDSEAPIEALRTFVEHYPNAEQVRLVKYSVAVRLARENQYRLSAEIYQALGASRRAARMRQLVTLYEEANRSGSPDARLRLAEFLAENQERVYFNNVLWRGFQGHAFQSSTDSRLTGAEREQRTAGERKLKDEQEERWRAYLILRDVVRDSGKMEISRKAAVLAIQCLRRISGRFGREDEIRRADLELSKWLQGR
jgi:hypothetical protein